MQFSVVLPCYNEEANIAASVRDVSSWMQRTGIQGEVIVVDDGSKDGSREVLKELGKDVPNLRVIHHEKNGGYGVAVRSGCDAATTEWIGFMDSDGQFHAEDFDQLIARTGEFDFVSGRRLKRADPFIRRLFGKFLAGMNVVMLGLWVHDINCGMKMFKKSIWPSIRPTHGVEKLFNTEVFLKLKRQRMPWVQVKIPHYPRTAGTPTGGSIRVIFRMFKELWGLKWAK